MGRWMDLFSSLALDDAPPAPPAPAPPSAWHCVACGGRLALWGYVECAGCQRFAHTRCAVALSAVPAAQPDNERAVVSAMRAAHCASCALAVLAQRYVQVQRERGREFHTAGHELSSSMKLMLRSVGAFFAFLGIRDGAGLDNFHRNREQAVFSLYAKAPAALVGRPLEVGSVWEAEIGIDGDEDVTVFVPADPLTVNSVGSTLVVLAWHGGAFVMGNHKAPPQVQLLRHLCAGARVVCVSANYRKAPEHLYPSWIDDAEKALRWVRDALPAWLEERGVLCLRGRPFRIATMGDSAGGNLAVALPHRLERLADPCYRVSFVLGLSGGGRCCFVAPHARQAVPRTQHGVV